MPTVSEIRNRCLDWAKPEWKEEWDNVGLLCGSADAGVRRVLVALDVTGAVAEEAKALGAELIVSHHPLFFELKTVTDATWTGSRALTLAENRIAAICMHTNLDAAEGGVNDALAEALGLEDTFPIAVDGVFEGREYGIGRVGVLPGEMTVDAFLRLAAEKLKAPGLKYHDAGRPVRKVGVVGGSGGSDLAKAIGHGCDTFVTADVKYNVWLEAKEAGINLIDAGHFCTENTVIPVLQAKLSGAFPALQVKISEKHCPTAQFFVR